MDYEGTIIRPPSEANSILLQVMVGCPHNQCTFCGAYKEVDCRVKDAGRIAQDIAFARRHCQRLHRVFLIDGDVLALPQPRLTAILRQIGQDLPWVNRVSLYGRANSIIHKSMADLRELKGLGLHRVYMGLESGHDPTLARIRKGTNSAQMIEAGQKIRRAGMFLSVTALLGVAGNDYSQEHAEATGRVLTAMAPNQIAVLTLMLLANTPLYQERQRGEFTLPDQPALLAELRTLVANLHLDRVQFQANHASNYLPINCRLKRDKDDLLHTLDQAVAGEINLVPETLRAL